LFSFVLFFHPDPRVSREMTLRSYEKKKALGLSPGLR
jgi:hypothetical protein